MWYLRSQGCQNPIRHVTAAPAYQCLQMPQGETSPCGILCYSTTRWPRLGLSVHLPSISWDGRPLYWSNMAPDLNSVPPSPRPPASSPHVSTSRIASRAASQQMAPPALTPSSPSNNILPSNQSAISHASSPLASTTISLAMAAVAGDNTGVGTGPGPLRHPRPMTAADLHLELEREQEAVVCPQYFFEPAQC